MPNPDADLILAAIEGFEIQRQRLAARIAELRAMLGGPVVERHSWDGKRSWSGWRAPGVVDPELEAAMNKALDVLSRRK